MKKELELYVHIPFCIRKCAYCDFLSGPASAKERQEYVDALTTEIGQYKKTAENYEVTSIFLGGGTPSVLTGEQAASVFYALNSAFQVREDAEITMEVNPGTVSETSLASYRQSGVNRLSIGLQSTLDEELQLLGRIHTYEDFLKTYELARKSGFTNINIDLISAVPGQTIESFAVSLHRAAKLNPQHISVYSLIIEEGTPFYEMYGNGEGALKLPGEEEDRLIYQATNDILKQYGYERYEISNYAKPGYACRHNMGYWECKEYLGIGVGAASLFKGKRYSHISDRKEYVRIMKGHGDEGELKTEEEVLSIRTQMEEMMFLGLRKTKGVDKETFYQRFGMELNTVYETVVEKLKSEGLLHENESHVRLTDRGLDLSNYAMMQFLEPDITVLK